MRESLILDFLVITVTVRLVYVSIRGCNSPYDNKHSLSISHAMNQVHIAYTCAKVGINSLF